jgi:multiple sugar transport system ATP-binding protein
MSSVTVKDLGVSYNKGRTTAVEDVSFTAVDAEFCVLLGPSGCGKTTGLLSIAGLIKPDQGVINIGSKPVTDVQKGIHIRPQDRNIAMVFQEYALYPNLTVRGNMAFPLETRGADRGTVKRKVQETAEILGIETLLDRRPAQLSGGQRQRVALGRALVRDPDVFLLDEPLGNIDAKLRVQVRYELKRTQRQLGVTMVYVTHDQVEAMAMADQIVLMNEGHIAQAGHPNELYDRPAERFVAGFLGIPPINFLECALVAKDGALALDAGDIVLPLSDKLSSRLSGIETGTQLVAGIRPADLVRAEDSSAVQLPLIVDVVEPGGDNLVVHGRVGETSLTAKWTDAVVSPGDVQKVAFIEERLHLFDRDTGASLIV